MTLDYRPVRGLGDMPEFGVMLCLDADYDQIRYYGLGRRKITATAARGPSGHLPHDGAGQPLALPRAAGVWQPHGRALGRGDGPARAAAFVSPRRHGVLRPALHAPRAGERRPRLRAAAGVRNGRARLPEADGVGGDDSWGARTHDEYLLDVSGRKTFTFSFMGIV